MTALTLEQVQEILPHRYPFLLVDRIVELENNRVVGLKAVTANEHFFQGHFPGHAVMPGVLILEALAQTGAVGVLHQLQGTGRIPMLVGLDACRIRRQVIPGDVLHLEVTLERVRSRAGRGHGIAKVLGEVAAEGDITFVLADPRNP